MLAEIKFRRDTSFRKQFFVPNSFAHPAKMDAQLLIWIVEKYSKVGETILDPMAGSGTTMLACTLGRDVVLVELEAKFCKMMSDNWKEVRMRPQLGNGMGRCEIYQGDARQLGELLVDKIISSPPYSDISMGGGLNTKPPREGMNDQSGRNMSPSQAGAGRYDSIITSPPYEGSVSDGQHNNPGSQWARRKERLQEGGYLKDAQRHGFSSFEVDWTYGKAEGNIGNLKSQSYLEAMILVYQQCYKVLKDGGLMILVTKNFIRNKQVIRLDTDTIKLCEQAGFKFFERHYRKLPAQSFWRIIYYKKHPEVERLDYEDVLVFVK